MPDNVFYRSVSKEHLVVDRGEGIYLYDKNGNRYIDACAGAAVTNVGHGNAKVINAMLTQAQRVAFTHLSRWTSEPVQKLADMVAAIAPGSLNKLYLVSGGSEATESALKMARQYFLERDGVSGKYKIISRWKSFHGNTIGSLSMTGDNRRKKYTPLLLDFPKINPPYCYRCDYGKNPASCGLDCAYELEKVLMKEGADSVAAFIAEPVIGAASGAVVPPDGYFKAIREICDKHDILFIADEVMTGFGRTGSMFALEQFGVIPDLITVAKGMSAGYIPLGGVVVKDEIFETFKKGSGVFVHGHTYGGNPLAAAVAVAVLEVLQGENLVENSRVVGQYLLHKLQEKLAVSRVVGDVRGRGLLQGVEIVKDKYTKTPFSVKLGIAEMATLRLMQHGVVVYPGNGAADGISGDHFLLAPPLILTREQADELVQGIVNGFAELEQELHRSGELN
ncbi:MAG: aspartate aminotransferase family protein [Syntrophomonadaceae bacterium]|nr:aspartate aminotransferase family protein [Syntrophomonadaceae bacterium]